MRLAFNPMQSDAIQSILIEHAMQSGVKSNYTMLPLFASIYGILMSEIMPKERSKSGEKFNSFVGMKTPSM